MRFLLIFFSIFLYASECSDSLDCLKNANYYQFDEKDIQNAVKIHKISCNKYKNYESCNSLSKIYANELKNEKFAKIYKEKSINYSQKKCTQNDANACFYYAIFCEDRQVKCKNFNDFYEKALNLYEKECENGNFDSCYYLANMHLNGIATSINPTKAYDLYELACAKGEPKSCTELAQLYKILSIKYLKKACDLGFEYACKELK